ncbi:MAG: excinuclease ABC subunit UvrC [Firmicutes bacterium]|nr:excinuclease ABC subunit UvrC [Bacillota bacterium]
MFDIKEELKKLPDSPGVYIHKDEFGQVIYVGKAISLKKRVRQYFQSSSNQTPKTRELVKHIAEFEHINTASEMEALVLECNLIKKYQPKYNILLRDDKTYPYIKVTLGEEFPRVLKCRKVTNDSSKYFGPYASNWATNEILDLLNSAYALKRCSTQKFDRDFKPCLNFHIHQCKGLCTGNVSREEYMETIDRVMDFLSGKNKELKKELEDRMAKASEEMRFEDAAKLRDQIAAIDTISEKQRVVLSKPENLDIVMPVRGLSGDHILLFTVRDGRLSGRESFFMGDDSGEGKAALISEFIKQYYFSNVMIPKEILVSEEVLDCSLLEEWLSSQRGSKVRIFVPERGEKRALMEVVRKDALMMLSDIDAMTQREMEKTEAVRKSLADVFGEELGNRIHRVESYDISNLNGMDSVGAMVVFEDGKPVRKDYRRFKIKTLEGQDDTGSLMEVLFRRYKRALEGDPGFVTLPDAIFMDGGLGQVHAAQEVLAALKLDIPVAGMVKDDKHRTRALLWQDVETPLRGHSELFAYCGAIQEEVHRFAIEYHRNLRSKALSRSVLDDIEGVGEKRKTALLAKFGSVENIKKATVYEIAETEGMNMKVAEKVAEYFGK